MWKQTWRARSKYSMVRQHVDEKYMQRVDRLLDKFWYQPGWKSTVTLGALVTGFCFGVNIALMIWAYAKNGGGDAATLGNGLSIFEGECSEANHIVTWSHLAINVASTLILSAGTSCMQVLASPTREEVDAAHREGRWFHIGLLSSRNLLGIKRVRLVLYLTLSLSSVAIHFFYNSIIYSTLGVNDSLTIITTDRFITESAVNSTRLNEVASARQAIFPQWDYGNNTGYNIWKVLPLDPPQYPTNDQLLEVVNGLKPGLNSTVLRNVTWSDCLYEFQSTPYKKIQNVAIVTSLADSQNDILDLTLTLAPGEANWACNAANGTYRQTNEFLGACAQELNGTMPALQVAGDAPIDQDWKVNYCLIEDSPGHCEVTFAPVFMIPVLAMNGIKLFAMVFTVYFLKFRPLVTPGDAVVSFMERPDPTVEGVGAHSTQSVSASAKVEYLLAHLPGRKAKPKKESFMLIRSRTGESGQSKRQTKKMNILTQKHESLMHKHAWVEKRRRWASAVSRARWIVTLIPWTTLVLATIAYSILARPSVEIGGNDNIENHEAWSQGLGEINPGFIIRDLANNNLATLVVISNIPQLGIACLTVLSSALLSSMVIASEMADFARDTKGMRVSPPRQGAQRTSYFLQIPYRYSVPLLTAAIVLHWLVSQSLFLVRLSRFNINDQMANKTLLSTLGYSLRGIASTAGVAGIITLAPVFLSLRRFPLGIPILGYNSMALSIACQPSAAEPSDAHKRPLRYGLIEGSEEDGSATKRLGFSANPVQPIEDGVEYEARRCLSTVLTPDADPDVVCTLDTSMRIFKTNSSYEETRVVGQLEK